MSELEQQMDTEENGQNLENGGSGGNVNDSNESAVINEANMENGKESVNTTVEDTENNDAEEIPKFGLPDKAPKSYGIKANPEEEALEAVNKELMQDADYAEVENLQDHLQAFKEKFLEFDKDAEGNIDMFGLSRMLEKLGQPKTHLEMKKMIREIDRSNKGTICYRDFIAMMIGPKNSVLKLILLFEGKSKEQEKPTGVAPKRDLASLP